MQHYGYAGLLAGLAGLLAVVGAIAGSTVSANEHGSYVSSGHRRLRESLRTRLRAHPRAVRLQLACLCGSAALLVLALGTLAWG